MVIDLADLAELRAVDEEDMSSTCLITRAGTGASSIDPSTLAYVDPARVTVYEGKCKILDAGQFANAGEDIAAAAVWATQGRVVKLPVATSTGIRQNDVVKILTNPADLELVDREFTVKGLHHKTQATSRRLMCLEGV